MRRLLDTNICIYLIKSKPPRVLERFRGYEVGDVGISSITLAELQYGAAKSHFPKRNFRALEKFVLALEVPTLDSQAAAAYGLLRAKLERQGTPIGSMDLLIAAHALSLGVVLVTNNAREFRRVKGLRVENWA